MSPIVEFVDIVKNFPGVQALKGVSLTIEKGTVHALVGENGAGKSTLMNILGGLYQPDSGEVRLKNERVHIRSQHAARKMGIGVVYQELRLCPNLTITENIFLGREREVGKGKVDWRAMRDRARVILEGMGSELDPGALVGRLSVANQQVVEIAKAISLDAEIIIMDEPTSALTHRESDRLFENIRALKAKGVTIIYISHRMEEVFSISDYISVLRDGSFHGTFARGEVSPDRIINLIAGRELAGEMAGRAASSPTSADRPAVLEVRNLSREGWFRDVSFELKEKEILGVYGLQGAGRTELLETIFGLARESGGEVVAFGEALGRRTPASAIRRGFAMVPENRRDAGIFPDMSILENINSANAPDISGPLGFLKKRLMRSVCGESRRSLNIKMASPHKKISELSGGNQQKVIIAKWLATRPRILLVDEPTRGIDVGAKAEIFRILRDLRDKGLSVLIISSEIAEIVAECDRVLVMRHGRMEAELAGEDITKERILRHAL